MVSVASRAQPVPVVKFVFHSSPVFALAVLQATARLVEQRINSEVYIIVLLKPMSNPLGVSPSKGKQGTTRGKEKIF